MLLHRGLAPSLGSCVAPGGAALDAALPWHVGVCWQQAYANMCLLLRRSTSVFLERIEPEGFVAFPPVSFRTRTSKNGGAEGTKIRQRRSGAAASTAQNGVSRAPSKRQCNCTGATGVSRSTQGSTAVLPEQTPRAGVSDERLGASRGQPSDRRQVQPRAAQATAASGQARRRAAVLSHY